MMPAEDLDETQILAALLGIAEMVSGLTDTEELLEAIVRIAPGLVRVDRCALLAYDDAAREFRTVAAFAPPGVPAAFTGLVLTDGDIPKVAHRLVKQRLPVLVKDAAKDQIVPPAIGQRLGMRSALIAPLVSRDRVLGILWLDSTKGQHYFTSKEINVAQGIATHAAIAMDNARTTQDLGLERRRFAAVVRSLCDGVIVVDEDLRILSVDEGAERLLGWTSAEVRGRRISEVFDITESQARVSWTREADGPSPVPKTLDLRAHDGARVPLQVLTSVVRDEDGGVQETIYALRRRPGTKDADERAVEALDQLADESLSRMPPE
ncbi:MAG: hypothetical protein A3K66_00555 [Euryarchaeota archaeon RBG_16_67_27]|nr:MAG: hypothetical protein A3K66_00555 [Euryarchaeota archaeon RBG_16_67_27]